MRFSQTIALITGAGSGIGKAAALRISIEGAKVILAGRTRSKLESTAAEILADGKLQNPEVFPADVTNKEEVASLADFLQRQFGDLHVLINNERWMAHYVIRGGSCNE